MLQKTNTPDFSQFTANNCVALLQTSQSVWPTLCSWPYGLSSLRLCMFFFQPPVLWNVSTVFRVSRSCMKTHQALAGEKLASLYGLLCTGVKCLQFASEMSCQAFGDVQVVQFVSLFWYSWSREYWQSIGKALQVFVSSGSAAINYVAQVLTHVTLCCHSYREMVLMFLSFECNRWLSVIPHANSKKRKMVRRIW